MPKINGKNVLHILGEKIKPGEVKTIDLSTAKLYTHTDVNVPIIIEHSRTPGPVVLITAGIHGDEINGVEIVRQLIRRKINEPEKGTIICIPVVNIYGFLNMERTYPDGRDLNRVFPGTKSGSLASRFAYQLINDVLPVADLCIDFHAGGAKRFNAPQIRINEGNSESLKYAQIFNAPFTVYSKLLSKSYREACVKKDLPCLLFEGGMSADNNKEVAKEGVDGVMRILKHLGMLKEKQKINEAAAPTIMINDTRWIRAGHSGLFHNKINIGDFVRKGQFMASITDPYGTMYRNVKAPNDGYIININYSPIVYQGDAIYHISKEL